MGNDLKWGIHMIRDVRVWAAIGFALLPTPSMTATAAEQLERTRVAEQLIPASLDAGRSPKAFAKAIFDYCSQTSNHMPRNTQKEDEQIAAAYASFNIDRLKQTDPLSIYRYELQKSLNECKQNSKSIVEQNNRPAIQAALWIKIEGSFDSFDEATAVEAGIVRKDEKGTIVSDLHGIFSWPAVRTAIRAVAVGLLSQPQ
jgi:hypothetical protein